MSPSPLTFMLPCTTSTPLPHLHISTFLNTSTLISSSTWQSDLTLKQAFHLEQSVHLLLRLMLHCAFLKASLQGLSSDRFLFDLSHYNCIQYIIVIHLLI